MSGSTTATSRPGITSCAYLGPRGTFTEVAAQGLMNAAVALTPVASVTQAFDQVRRGLIDSAVVPIENSVEGSVSTTLDELAQGEPLVIIDEIAIPVAFDVVARPGTSLADVRTIATHPHAEAQCRGWLSAHLPGVTVIPATSTAAAAAAMAEGTATWDAAVSAPAAAAAYGLDILANNVGDNPEAATRFILVARPGSTPAATGADKTTLVLYMRENHPGALLEILTEFAVRGVDLTRIESRPTRRALGDYFFSVDCEGHITDTRVGEALMGLHRVCADVRFLGSYPRHDGVAPRERYGTTETDFMSARAWLDELRRTHRS